MAELFSTSRTNIIEHINNIYEEEELNKDIKELVGDNILINKTIVNANK